MKVTNFKAQLGGLNILFILGLLAVAAVAAIVVFHVLAPAKASTGVVSLPQSNAPMPSNFAAAVSDKQNALSLLTKLSATHLQNQSTLNVTYTGSLYAKISGIPLISSFTTPVSLNYVKYYNDTRLVLGISLPVIGDTEVQYLELSNASYVCSNLNISAMVQSGPAAVFQHKKGWSCIEAIGSLNFSFSNLTGMNLPIMPELGIFPALNTSYQSEFNGMPCTYVKTTIPGTVVNGTVVGGGEMATCISNAYYVPLSFALYFAGKSNSASMVLNESAISAAVPASSMQLPGPVEKLNQS